MCRLRRSVLLALVGTPMLAGCGISPTLPPLPPPDEPQRFNAVSEGVVLVEGTLPVDEAKVFILNHNTDLIFGRFVHEPRYAIEVEAKPGEFLSLWYSTQGVDSDSVAFELPELEVASDPSETDAGQ